MPELPEVETVRRGLAPTLVGATIAGVELRRHDLRVPFPHRFAARLQGSRILDLRRRAKYLIADLDDGQSLIMHLGMSGSFRIDEATPGALSAKTDKIAAHDHVVFHLDHGRRVVYNDPRRFGCMLLIPTHSIDEDKRFRGLGVEPLSGALDAACLASAFRGRAAPVKALLLDQRLIAGLGNIYVCEALHRAHISPLRGAGSLVTAGGRPKAVLAGLPQAIKDVLKDALEAGGSSLRDHRQIDGSLGYFQHSFRVYDREGAACPTPGCKGTIARVVQSGRSTFYCAACQK
jgi:formamidopyrimidine-DNA glycosylase